MAVLVVPVRPLIAALATAGSTLNGPERAFTGWTAPRGIVAATASAFGGDLVQHGYAGASTILPVVFLVIVATVLTYGLTPVPLARRLKLSPPPA
ncbi:hypothetical protein ABZ747_26290 [Kitasatospora cineracea]|uniref:hypothetical protein n=1 Tax=Kitasatospora cineracea TaxID=88074 RepID=UPI0033F6BD07